MAINYKSSGVDIEAGDSLVDWLKNQKSNSSPHADRIVSGVGGFAALFRGGFPQMKSPCLVSCTDGVGTKVKLATQFNSYQSIAQDLVAMCVNDLICSGGIPLFFLDYYASGKLNLENAKSFLSGVRIACEKSHCALIGGETAEMPGVYHGDDFDCAGFAVGVVDEANILGSHKVNNDDVIIGIRSSGFHSNGYSLLRKLFENDLEKWSDYLLKPTELYVEFMLKAREIEGVHSAAHITGGGMDNILRVVPNHLDVHLDPWKLPKEFIEAKNRSHLNWREFLTTFNGGIGFILIVDRQVESKILDLAKTLKLDSFRLGSFKDQVSETHNWFLNELEMNQLNLV